VKATFHRYLYRTAVSTAAVLVFVGEFCAEAETVLMNPGGYQMTVCPSGSDTIVSVPFRRDAAFSGRVGAAVSVNGTAVTIPVEGTPSFASGKFTDESFYLRFTGTSDRAGHVYTITSHDNQSVTIEAGNHDLSSVAVGDRFVIVPHWTLATLFPQGEQDTIHESGGVFRSQRKTEVLFFDESRSGIDLAPDRIYFLTATGWVQSKSGFPVADEVLVRPGSALVIRHRPADPATEFLAFRQVIVEESATDLPAPATGRQEKVVGSIRPVRVKLSDLDLEGSTVFEESATTAAGDRKDELHLFDNIAVAINKAPSAVYFRAGGNWVEDTAGFPVANDVEIDAGAGLMIRKAATPGGAVHVWMNTPRY